MYIECVRVSDADEGDAVKTLKNVVKKTDARMTARYGRRIGRVAMFAFVLGLPVPLPCASLICAAPVMLVGEIVRLTK
jgi:hypothetical protein